MHTTKTRSCPIASGIALPVMIFSGALVLLSVLLFSRGGHCAPAIPTGRQFQQPDGTTFSARLWGDERAHGWETLNGYSIVKDPKTNYWCYAQMDPTTKGLIPGNTVSDQGSIKGTATDIWSHRWNLRSAAYYGDGSGVYTTDDVATCGQIKVNDYVIQPETLYDEIQTVGVFAHEYGHVLGLPDLYDTDGSSSGIGNWGLMASGTWNGVQQWGDSPAHLSAWSKYTMGWIDPVVVSSELSNESIDPASATGDAYQFFPFNQTDSKEYFLVENRQRLGFDAGLPGTGLAIWYIDERKASYRNADNTDECLPHLDCSDTHYRVSLVQADGYWDLEYGFNRGDQGDLFPGRFQNRAFNRSSDPDSLLYDGTSSQVSITDIIQSNPTVTATMALVCTITPTVSTGGHISPGGSTVIYPGDTLTFTLTPQDGYQLGAVYVDGQSVGAVSEYTFSNIQSDHDIRADFTSNGSISQSGGANSGGGGGGCFITISSTSFTSALFNHWSR